MKHSIRHGWRLQVDCTLGRAAIGFNTKATNCRIGVAKPRQWRQGVLSVGKASIGMREV
jgi:hypothetical protein